MKKPNPGSDEAIKQGCVCPVLDNAHGRGWMGGVKDPDTGGVVFVYRVDCPLHKPEIKKATSSCKGIE